MNRIKRRTFLKGLAATLALPLAARAEQPYPAGKAVKIIVAYPPGGTSDVVGRIVADQLTATWGVPVIVENVAGANGNIGNERVAKGPVNGTQLLVMTTNVATNQFLYPRLNYDPERDLTPVSCVARLPNLLVVRNDLPVNSVSELIVYAKAHPGKLNYGSPGTGSSPHLSAEMFKRLAGVEMTAIQYRGSGPALADLAAGTNDLMFDNITAAIGMVRAGKIKGLAVTSARPSSLAPEVPTVAQTVPGFDVTSFHGVGVRSGTPAHIVAKIESDVMALAKTPVVKEHLAKLMAEAVGSSSAEFA